MAEYKTGVQVNYGFGLSFEASGKAPVIAKRIWETLADAQAYVDSATDTAIAGLQLTVINDTDASKNGVYFVKEAAGFPCKVTISKDGKEVDAKRILGVMSLGVKQGMEITVTCDGDKEDEAAGGLEKFLKENL